MKITLDVSSIEYPQLASFLAQRIGHSDTLSGLLGSIRILGNGELADRVFAGSVRMFEGAIVSAINSVSGNTGVIVKGVAVER